MGRTITDYNRAMDATVMAIREELMMYYKGNCVDKFVYGNVGLESLENTVRGEHRYLRRENEIHQPTMLTLGRNPIMKLHKMPNELVFNELILQRSPEFTEVYARIEKFMHKYLRGVRIKANKEPVAWNRTTKANADHDIIMANFERVQSRQQEVSGNTAYVLNEYARLMHQTDFRWNGEHYTLDMDTGTWHMTEQPAVRMVSVDELGIF